MGKWALLLFDLLIVVASPFVSILLRDNFLLIPEKLHLAVPYALNCGVVALAAFLLTGVHRGVWRYVSLYDLTRVIRAVTTTVVVSAFIAFTLKFYQGIALSVPFIQWAFIMTMMCLVRLTARMISDRSREISQQDGGQDRQTVLVVGVNDIAELYLRWTQKIYQGRIEIVGLLDELMPLRGRFVQSHQVVGRPSELTQLLAKYKMHGVRINRIVLAEPLEKLGVEARKAIKMIDQQGEIVIDELGRDIREVILRSTEHAESEGGRAETISEAECVRTAGMSFVWSYPTLKRAGDVALCFMLGIVLAPLIGIVALAVLLRHGYPITFWQSRVGLNGRRFRVYKFRSMSPGWDKAGNEIPAERRISGLGRFLRRSRLDELPQLYNILIGEMSFVGPRPLLKEDQPENSSKRLSVRPGLTGWAQINGGQAVSREDKAVLDLWYLRNASLWLDLKIILLTGRVVLSGERVNAEVIRRAYRELGMHLASRCAPAAKLTLTKNKSGLVNGPCEQKVA